MTIILLRQVVQLDGELRKITQLDPQQSGWASAQELQGRIVAIGAEVLGAVGQWPGLGSGAAEGELPEETTEDSTEAGQAVNTLVQLSAAQDRIVNLPSSLFVQGRSGTVSCETMLKQGQPSKLTDCSWMVRAKRSRFCSGW